MRTIIKNHEEFEQIATKIAKIIDRLKENNEQIKNKNIWFVDLTPKKGRKNGTNRTKSKLVRKES